jgi:hypothetical protein
MCTTAEEEMSCKLLIYNFAEVWRGFVASLALASSNLCGSRQRNATLH